MSDEQIAAVEAALQMIQSWIDDTAPAIQRFLQAVAPYIATVQRQRITAAKRRARIVTRAKRSKRA